MPIRPLECCGQQVVIDARLVVEAFQVRGGDQLDEVAIAFLVFAEQHQVVVAVGIAARLVALLRNVHLAADHRMDALRLGGVVELHRAEEIAVIGHGHRGHLLLDHDLHQLVDIAGAVEQRIVGMAMQMDEGHSEISLPRGRWASSLFYRVGQASWPVAAGHSQTFRKRIRADRPLSSFKYAGALTRASCLQASASRAVDIHASQHVTAGLESLERAQVARPQRDVARLFGAQPLAIPIALHQVFAREQTAHLGVLDALSLIGAVGHDVQQRLERRARRLHAAVLKVLQATRVCASTIASTPAANWTRSCFSGRSISSVNTAPGVSKIRPGSGRRRAA